MAGNWPSDGRRWGILANGWFRHIANITDDLVVRKRLPCGLVDVAAGRVDVWREDALAPEFWGRQCMMKSPDASKEVYECKHLATPRSGAAAMAAALPGTQAAYGLHTTWTKSLVRLGDLSPDAFYAYLSTKPLRLSWRWWEVDGSSCFSTLTNGDRLLLLHGAESGSYFVRTNPDCARLSLSGLSVPAQFECGPKSTGEFGMWVVPVDLDESPFGVMRGRWCPHLHWLAEELEFLFFKPKSLDRRFSFGGIPALRVLHRRGWIRCTRDRTAGWHNREFRSNAVLLGEWEGMERVLTFAGGANDWESRIDREDETRHSASGAGGRLNPKFATRLRIHPATPGRSSTVAIVVGSLIASSGTSGSNS